MVKQLNGEYKVKNMGLKPLYDRVKQLLAGCTSVEIKHIYRSENSAADELANKAIDEFENREEPQQQLPQKQPNDMPEQGNLF